MDASRWDDEKMVITSPKPGEMNPPMPVMVMEPEMNFVPDEADYICPLYKTGLRAGTLSTTGKLCCLLFREQLVVDIMTSLSRLVATLVTNILVVVNLSLFITKFVACTVPQTNLSHQQEKRNMFGENRV